MRKLIFSISILFLTGLNYQANAQLIQGVPHGNIKARQWAEEHFAKGKTPPFSFIYGGKSSDTFIKSWKYRAEKLKSKEPNVDETLYTYSDKNSGLVIKCTVTCFTDFPAVEWVLRFSNTSGENSPVLENAAVVDYSFNLSMNGSFILHHARGSNAEISDFQPIDEKFEVGKSIYLTPSGGRSSDHTALPFFNIEMPGQQGVVVAVGWTGKWYADVSQLDGKSVSLKSGMEKMHLVLNPKEEIRTPKICLLFWKGDDRMIGHNCFRQFLLVHHSRKIDGKFAECPLSGSFDVGDPAPCLEYECLTEEYAIALVKRYQQFDILPELFWLDAGWYTGCNGLDKDGKWGFMVGNWTVDKKRFPNGLRPVADAVHQTGAKFMVWFEPERARPETQMYIEHPDWLIKIPKKNDCLLNLGNKEALNYLINYTINFLEKEGIDYYRQDFNLDPKPYWDANDKPDRIGISEIRHIEGLYTFWDSLLVRFPKLLIDNCASGGRRLDLETTSRSAPLWRTDYQFDEPNGSQCHTFGLNFYLPVHGTGLNKTDGYSFRSGLGAAAIMNWEVTGRGTLSIPDARNRIQEFKKIRPYFYADYYPLSESTNNTGNDVWLAYQLNRPKENDGIIVAFRRKNCPDESITIKLRGLNKDFDYECIDEDTGKKSVQKGEVLINGITLFLAEKEKSLQISYQKVKK